MWLNIDIKENDLLKLNPYLLNNLLKDQSSGKNIIWATDEYSEFGDGFNAEDEITFEKITGANGRIIMPRSVKSKETQNIRTKDRAEVFTPTWICNKQNNIIDAEWFGRADVFNIEDDYEWKATEGKITFPNRNKTGLKSWMSYLVEKRIEITCGEAPYLVSRYDATTGRPISIRNRIGLLDRKLRVVNERCRNLSNTLRVQNRWKELALKAVKSIYGYDWQGDNVLLARENILYTIIDYYKDKFNDNPSVEMLMEFSEVISWNIWQMDGMKCVIPNSCRDYKTIRKEMEPNLFDNRAFSSVVLKRSVSPCDINPNELMKCQGCLKNDVFLHNGIYCKIKDWSTKKVIYYKDISFV